VIFDWLIAPILAIITAVLGVLPTDTTFIGYSTDFNATAFAATWAPYVHMAAFFVDVEPLFLFAWLIFCFVMPALVIFQLAQWAYRELPDLWGFGPS
jgi:hypothetical protein